MHLISSWGSCRWGGCMKVLPGVSLCPLERVMVHRGEETWDGLYFYGNVKCLLTIFKDSIKQ